MALHFQQFRYAITVFLLFFCAFVVNAEYNSHAYVMSKILQHDNDGKQESPDLEKFGVTVETTFSYQDSVNNTDRTKGGFKPIERKKFLYNDQKKYTTIFFEEYTNDAFTKNREVRYTYQDNRIKEVKSLYFEADSVKEGEIEKYEYNDNKLVSKISSSAKDSSGNTVEFKTIEFKYTDKLLSQKIYIEKFKGMEMKIENNYTYADNKLKENTAEYFMDGTSKGKVIMKFSFNDNGTNKGLLGFMCDSTGQPSNDTIEITTYEYSDKNLIQSQLTVYKMGSKEMKYKKEFDYQPTNINKFSMPKLSNFKPCILTFNKESQGITISLTDNSLVSFELYSLQGRLVAQQAARFYPQGMHRISVKHAPMVSLLKLSVNNESHTIKLIPRSE